MRAEIAFTDDDMKRTQDLLDKARSIGPKSVAAMVARLKASEELNAVKPTDPLWPVLYEKWRKIAGKKP